MSAAQGLSSPRTSVAAFVRVRSTIFCEMSCFCTLTKSQSEKCAVFGDEMKRFECNDDMMCEELYKLTVENFFFCSSSKCSPKTQNE